MSDTFAKTIGAEPAKVSRVLMRTRAYRALATGLPRDVGTSITVTPALEGTTIAIRVAPHADTETMRRRWPAIAVDAGDLARALLDEVAGAMQPANGTLAAAA